MLMPSYEFVRVVFAAWLAQFTRGNIEVHA